MKKSKNEISLILWVIIVAIITITLVWLMNNDSDYGFKIPKTAPKNVVFPNNEVLTWSYSTWGLLNNSIENNQKQLKNEQETNKISSNNIINLSWKTWDLYSCDNIDDSFEKEKCINNSYAAKASLENNVDFCNKITDIEWKNRCLDSYYNEDAEKKQDYLICKNIKNTDLKDSCTSSIIISKIESPEYWWGSDICDLLNWDQKSYCLNKFTIKSDVDILWTAVENLNLNLCNKIGNSELKIKCKDVINFKTAINNSDISKCELIEEKNLNSQCILTLTQIKK